MRPFSESAIILFYRICRKSYRILLRILLFFLPQQYAIKLTESGIVSVLAQPEVAIDCYRISYDHQFVSNISNKQYEESTSSLSDFHVWWFNRVNLYSSTGVIVYKHRIVAESILKRTEVEEASLFRQYVPLNVKHIEGVCTTINATFGNNYGHWFIDSLARLYLLSQLNVDDSITLLCPDNLLRFQRDSLELCKPQNVSIKFVPAHSWINVETLVLPQFIRSCTNGYLPKEVMTFIRKCVFDGLGLSTEITPSRRLYISRSDIPRRQVTNENEVQTCLNKYGFEICLPQTLSFHEQVCLFREAEMVVGPYGSGLTNTIFSSPINVIELKSLPPEDLFFWRLSKTLGHNHYFVSATQKTRIDNMLVDVLALDRTLSNLVAG